MGAAPALKRASSNAATIPGDGEGHHLELGALKVAPGALEVLGTARVCKQSVGRHGEHALVERAVLVHNDLQDIVIERGVHAVDRKGAERLGHHHAPVELACIGDVLGDLRVQRAVQVAAAEMHPHGLLGARGLDRIHIELR